jgi:hypothetical protein
MNVITQQQQEIAFSHCITDDTVTGHNVAHSPAPSSWKTTSTADVNSGARHHYSCRPPFITDNPSKRRFLNDRVRASACSLASSSHNAGRAFTTTTAWLMALHILNHGWLPLINLGWRREHRAPQPRIAGHRRRTSNTWSVKHRSTVRETSPRRHCLNALQHACRTTSTVRFSFFTPPSVLVIISVSIDPTTRSGGHLCFPAYFNTFATMSTREWCGNLAQGDGLVTLTTSQAPVTPGPRTKLHASGTLASVAFSLESVVFQRTTSA